MLRNRYSDAEENKEKPVAGSGKKLVCNNCDVTLVFTEQPSGAIRKQVAELIVTAFERQIGVRERA